MAMTAEKRVKQRVVKILKERGVYYFYPVASGYASSGIPDIVCCYKGMFLGIECKANGNKPTPLQRKNINDIHGNGGFAIVVDENNTEAIVEGLLIELDILACARKYETQE